MDGARPYSSQEPRYGLADDVYFRYLPCSSQRNPDACCHEYALRIHGSTSQQMSELDADKWDFTMHSVDYVVSILEQMILQQLFFRRTEQD